MKINNQSSGKDVRSLLLLYELQGSYQFPNVDTNQPQHFDIIHRFRLSLLVLLILVVANDVFAYIFGKMFGKTQLIKLSPNKTVEGFIGGIVGTVFFSFVIYQLTTIQVIS